MRRILSGTRYLVIIPILGLALAAGAFFLFGGYSLIKLIVEAVIGIFMQTAVETHGEEIPFVIQVVEHVHTFLVGTVLYITAVGFYQLFIDDVEFHGWLKIDSTEDLEMNLIGVTVVVMAINFLTVVYSRDASALLEYGAGIAMPIAALALFVGMRSWSTHLAHQKMEHSETKDEHPDITN